MNYLRIRNWEKWQSWRSDRGQPPWIKLHRCVMRNFEWMSLTDAQRGHLVAIWLLAADRSGVIPASPRIIQKLCNLDSEPDLQLLTNLGFIEPDADLTPERRQTDADLTNKNRVDQIREDVDQIREDNIPQNAGVNDPQTAARKSTAKRNGQLSARQQAWFAEFWNRYPRKKDKGAALKAWGKLHVDEDTWGAISAALDWQVPEMQQKDISYVKYPATYLNAHGWESEPDKQTYAKSAGVFVDPTDEAMPF